MDAKDFLVLAEKLATGTTEAEWRSAVSRAYYAAFHAARNLLTACGFKVPRGEQAHAYLRMRLQSANEANVRSAGSDLHALKRTRNWADYDLEKPLTQADAKGAVRSARQIIQVFDAAAQQPLKTQITDAMKVYERDILKMVTWHP